jgi:vacuolar-type H+-ATPase subunit H
MNHPSNEPTETNYRYRLRNSSKRILRSTVSGNKKVANETGSKLKSVVKKGDTKEKKRGSKKKKKIVKEKKRAAKKTQGDQAACFPDPT